MEMQSSPHVWVVHAGRRGRDARQFEAAGIVGLALPPVEDLATLNRSDALKAVMRALAHDKPGVLVQSGRDQSFATLLLRFVHEMEIGDRVITADRASGEVLLGIVTGGYRLAADPPVPSYYHIRSVHWLGRMRRADLPAQAARSIGAPSPLFRPGAEEQLRALEIWLNDRDLPSEAL
ncbi:MAG: hypothetical protein ACRD2X_03100 [Vicinamibacteraceae bacterium]